MLPQIFAVAIFVLMFILIVTDKIERQWVTLGCGLLMMVLVFGLVMHSGSAVVETLNVKSIFESSFWYGSSEESSAGINWSTIIFIAGMMIMVEGMGHAGFMRWICLKLAKAVKYKSIPLLIMFMILSSVLAMFIDSITVILFLAAVTVELARLLHFSPIPMIISEVFCANLGGSATMSGDPPNIIIGTSLHYAFTDFLLNTGAIALVSLIFVVFYFYFAFRKKLTDGSENVDISAIPQPKDAIKDKRAFVISCTIFLIAIVLLVTHAQTELSVATIGVIVAFLTLVTAGKAIVKILKGVDYKTLLFFIGLFVVVGGLEQTGILDLIANFISSISGGSMYVLLAIIIVISAVASAFIDNVPFAAAMIPVTSDLSVMIPGANLAVLAWTLAIGTDIGGSATPIGASANVVGTSIAAKEGHPIGWGKYCKYSAPATAIVIAISLGCIYLRYL